MKRSVSRAWLVWIVLIGLSGGMTQAAWFERGTHDGGATDNNQTPECPPEGEAGDEPPDDECVTDIDELGNGDPNDRCLVGLGGSGDGGQQGYQHLESAIECIENNPSLEYTLRYDSAGVPFGLDIIYSDGHELNAICYRENRRTVQSVSVGLEREGRMARIAKLPAYVSFTAGREVLIELNGVQHWFFTDRGGKIARSLNNSIYFSLTRSGYSISDTGDFWIIHADPNGASITAARFSSDDPGVQSSAVSIEPINTANVPWCFPAPTR